ncbi:MAG: hypothetical protein QM503_09540 [Bacteroidota bacterium]
MRLSNKIIFISAFVVMLFSGLLLQSQTFGLNNGLQSNPPAKSKPQVSVSLSSSFASFGSGITSFGTTILPQVTFPVSDKFSISTGIGYSTFFVGNGSESMFNSSPASYGHVFVSGTYQVNEKISLRGTGYKTFNLAPTTYNSETNTMGYDYSSQGFIMDVEYKVTDNFRINIGFEYREQNSPMYNPNGMYFNNPHMNTMSPFSGFNNHNSLNPF